MFKLGSRQHIHITFVIMTQILCTVNLLRHSPYAGKCSTSTGCCDNQEAAGLLLCCARVFLNWQRADINIPPFLKDYRKREGRISMIIVNVLHTHIEVNVSFSHEKVSTRTGERLEVGLSCKFPNSDISRVRVSPKTVAWVWFDLILEYVWFLIRKDKPRTLKDVCGN